MLGFSLGLGPMMREGEGAAPPAPVTALFLGQSEMEHILSTGSFYRQLPQPIPGDGNLIVISQNGGGIAPVRTEVNSTTVAAGQVNPAMAALSAFLAYARPGRQFVVVDGAVSGTGRYQLADDDNPARLWSDLTAAVDLAEAEFGPIQSVVEMWFANDAGQFGDFINNYWPFYFGANGNGSAFTLGAPAPTGDSPDHCLWDAFSDVGAKGRGIFARSQTAWRMLGLWPRWSGLPTSPSLLDSYALQNNNMVQPMRDTMDGWVSNPLAQSVSMRSGPSCHAVKFGDAEGGSSGIHPSVLSRDGQILAVWPFAVELLRQSGITLDEPAIVGIEGPENGSYADLLVSLPNGGTLQTLRGFRGLAAATTPRPQQQAVTGIEIVRGGSRRPVYRISETGFPEAARGTVSIQSGAEIHPTYGRVGRVRVMPLQPFVFGNALSYLMGSAIAGLTDSDINADLYLDMLIEHIPALYDAAATYPFEGMAVRPFQNDISVTVPAPAFTAQSARFNGSSNYQSSSISQTAGSNGLLSFWFKNDDTAWNNTAQSIFALQVGSTAVLQAYTTTAGRLAIRLNNNTTADAVSFFAGPGNAVFDTGRWYHVLMGWGSTGATVWVNGVLVDTRVFAMVDMAGQTITRIGLGSNAANSQRWLGDIGHFYLNVDETLDLSLTANREKFAQAGAPVTLGGNGQLPTGNMPKWYYDGSGLAWSNQGSAGNVPLTGVLTAGGVPHI